MPRERVRSAEHDRTRSLGLVACTWIEHFCRHGHGDVEGAEVQLDNEFGDFIIDAYGLNRDGRRLYPAAVISRAKGRAKSELAAFIALLETFGPCRFSGWAEGGEVLRWRDFRYVYEPGEAMARPVTYPFVRICATEEGQTGNTYDTVFFNLTGDRPLGEGLPSSAAGLTRVLLPDGSGEIVPSTASSASKDGGKETFVVVDESHLYVTPELRRLHATVDRNLRKRRAAEPWMLQTTTAYQDGQDSIAERTHKRARMIADGNVRGTGLLYDHVEAPADVNLTDLEDMRRALRETYGPFAEVMDLDGIITNEFWNPEKDVADSRRYFFNQPSTAGEAWMAAPDWDARADVTRVIADGDTIAMFFDGSKSSDSSGLVGCRIDDGHVFVLDAWEKPADPTVQNWTVDRVDVDRAVRAAFDRWNVVAFLADLREFESYIDSWSIDFRDQLVIEATTGQYASAVGWDMRKKTSEFTAGAERFMSDVLDGMLTHDGDSRLRRHMLNARRRPNRHGLSFGKETRNSMNKVDLAVCAVGARIARQLLLASPNWSKQQVKPKKRSGKVVGFR